MAGVVIHLAFETGLSRPCPLGIIVSPMSTTQLLETQYHAMVDNVNHVIGYPWGYSTSPNYALFPSPCDDHTSLYRHAKSWLAATRPCIRPRGLFRIFPRRPTILDFPTPHQKISGVLQGKNWGLSNIFKIFRDYHHNEYFPSSSHIFLVASIKTLGVI